MPIGVGLATRARPGPGYANLLFRIAALTVNQPLHQLISMQTSCHPDIFVIYVYKTV